MNGGWIIALKVIGVVTGVGLIGYGGFYAWKRWIKPAFFSYQVKWGAFWKDPWGFISGKKKLSDVKYESGESGSADQLQGTTPRPKLTTDDVNAAKQQYELEKRIADDRERKERENKRAADTQQFLASAGQQITTTTQNIATATKPVGDALIKQTTTFIRDPIGTISKDVNTVVTGITGFFSGLVKKK